jgi:hypothetical protein
MQPSIGFWTFSRMCLEAATEATQEHVKWDRETVITGAILLFLGYVLIRLRRGKEDASKRVGEEFLWGIGPLVIVAIGLFIFNCIRSPYLVYRGIESRTNQIEQEKNNLASELEKEKDKSRPKFEVTTGTAIIASPVFFYTVAVKTSATLMIIPVFVFNHGAPSVIRDIRVFVRFKDGRETRGQLYLPNNKELILRGPEGPVSFPRSSSIIFKTSTPIPSGGQADGFASFQFPGDLMKDMRENAESINLEVLDVNTTVWKMQMPRTDISPKNFYPTPGMLEQQH